MALVPGLGPIQKEESYNQQPHIDAVQGGRVLGYAASSKREQKRREITAYPGNLRLKGRFGGVCEGVMRIEVSGKMGDIAMSLYWGIQRQRKKVK